MDDDTHKHKMKERGREIEREKERSLCRCTHNEKLDTFSTIFYFTMHTSMVLWHYLYTHQNANYVLSCSMLSLAQLNCFFSLL